MIVVGIPLQTLELDLSFVDIECLVLGYLEQLFEIAFSCERFGQLEPRGPDHRFSFPLEVRSSLRHLLHAASEFWMTWEVALRQRCAFSAF